MIFARLLFVATFALVAPAGAQTRPVQKDLSTPLAAAQTFINAVEAGDARTAKAAATAADPNQFKIVELLAELNASMIRLRAAATEQFSDFEQTPQEDLPERKLPTIDSGAKSSIQ